MALWTWHHITLYGSVNFTVVCLSIYKYSGIDATAEMYGVITENNNLSLCFSCHHVYMMLYQPDNDQVEICIYAIFEYMYRASFIVFIITN